MGFRARLAAAFPHWAARLGEDHVLTLDALRAVSETALTRDAEIAMGADGLPNTFVPGRNLLFFTFAAAIAYRRGLRHLVGGMCETDYSGYPDCRDDTLKALQVALNLGMARRMVIHTPLMWRDKAATWALARQLGGDPLVEAVRDETLSCYRGDRTQRHDWGFGCGACPACELRARGWQRWQAGRAG
jgi:7-cyano-7-deazaguanine synthase